MLKNLHSKQYEYVKKIEDDTQLIFKQVPMKSKKDWDVLEAKIKTGYKQSAFEILDNSQLNMFYVSKYMQDNLFYSEELDAYVIPQIHNSTIIINMVISDKEQDLNRIANGFGNTIKKVVLGFTPENTQGFEVREMNQNDTALHVKGDFNEIEEYKLMFPLLAHA